MGVNMPNNKLLARWFKDHDDGAGIAYRLPYDNVIHIHKGFMTTRELVKAKNELAESIKPYELADLDIIIHFRQATEGTTKPSNCHPFPFTADRVISASLKCETELAIAHNGIIYDYGTYTSSNSQWSFTNTADLTDTQQFIEDYMIDIGKDSLLHNGGVQELIIKHTESRWAFLSEEGILLFGTFIKDKGGLYFSNGGYKKTKTIVTTYPKQEALFDYSKYPDLYTGEDDRDRCDICGQIFPYDNLYDIDGVFICGQCCCDMELPKDNGGKYTCRPDIYDYQNNVAHLNSIKK
jgi:hypothetical protein